MTLSRDDIDPIGHGTKCKNAPRDFATGEERFCRGDFNWLTTGPGKYAPAL